MKQIIPKWQLEKIEVIRNGKIDEAYIVYELQKEGIKLCSFGPNSLKELKEFFAKLNL